MIGFLSGVLRSVAADTACIDVGGVGYRVAMPASDLAAKRLGDKVEAHVHTQVREDAIVLFAFLAPEGLALFERLIGVSGVGPKTALAALSGMNADELVRVIAERDEARLTKVPGVGKKTAARIVLELADAMAKEALTTVARGRVVEGGENDLRSALANLGYKAPQIDRAVQKVRPLVDDKQDLSALVRAALEHIGAGR